MTDVWRTSWFVQDERGVEVCPIGDYPFWSPSSTEQNGVQHDQVHQESERTMKRDEFDSREATLMRAVNIAKLSALAESDPSLGLRVEEVMSFQDKDEAITRLKDSLVGIKAATDELVAAWENYENAFDEQPNILHIGEAFGHSLDEAAYSMNFLQLCDEDGRGL